MIRNSKMQQRLFDMSVGFMCALAVMSLWSLVNNKPNLFSGFFGCWTLFCLLIGFVLMRRRKLIQKPASDVLSEDKRPPVVYLRSFKDDEITSHPIRESALPIFFTEEEYLADVLSDFGPCIAIGQPGEKLPDLGAARMYIDDNAWQDKVKELLISSKLVVLRAGKTQNFLWEVEQSIKNVNPKNLIILIPKIENTYNQFRTQANRNFPKPLPENIGVPNLISGIASLHGYIYFDEDWTPHFIKFEIQISFWRRSILDLTKYVIRNSLAPIYDRLGMIIPKTEGSNFGVVLASFLFSILCLFIFNR